MAGRLPHCRRLPPPFSAWWPSRARAPPRPARALARCYGPVVMVRAGGCGGARPSRVFRRRGGGLQAPGGCAPRAREVAAPAGAMTLPAPASRGLDCRARLKTASATSNGEGGGKAGGGRSYAPPPKRRAPAGPPPQARAPLGALPRCPSPWWPKRFPGVLGGAKAGPKERPGGGGPGAGGSVPALWWVWSSGAPPPPVGARPSLPARGYVMTRGGVDALGQQLAGRSHAARLGSGRRRPGDCRWRGLDLEPGLRLL